MLRLVLMRHGEAEAELAASTDRVRALTQVGHGEARETGRLLKERGWAMPEIGLVSDARRALETRDEVAKQLTGLAWRETRRLYLAPCGEIFDVLSELDAEGKTSAIIVAHNPGLAEAVAMLSGQGLRMGTAEAAILEIDAPTWGEGLDRAGRWTLQGAVRGTGP